MTEKTQPSGTIPEHYRRCCAVIEPRDILKLMPFQLGNACKYLLRAKYKGNEKQDLLKALDYLTWADNRCETIKDRRDRRAVVLLVRYFDNEYLTTLFNPCYDGEDYRNTIDLVKERIRAIDYFDRKAEREKQLESDWKEENEKL